MIAEISFLNGTNSVQVLRDGMSDDQVGRLKTFVRETRQRYIDPQTKVGILALDAAVAQIAGFDQLDPFRKGLFVVTATGPDDTRAKLQDGYKGQARQALSGTIFSSCGYNIAGSVIARSHGVRGPVLTFGAVPGWQRQTSQMAQSMVATDRVDWIGIVVLAPDRASVFWPDTPCMSRAAS